MNRYRRKTSKLFLSGNFKANDISKQIYLLYFIPLMYIKEDE